MPSIKSGNRLYDARPDRVDLRDRTYQPPLVSLEKEIPAREFVHQNIDDYVGKGLILNQGKQGSCTGYGLSAVINYLLWKRCIDGCTIEELQHLEHEQVSPDMLYHLAKTYDEWPGESYEGSSCRGAMKGWHKHGVCCRGLWDKPWKDNKTSKTRGPQEGWSQDAASRPLGAYYRVNHESILDMQAAIQEVGAIYVSAEVHNGWTKPGSKTLSVMKMSKAEGGHAFALVGYNELGFIVQNSWGSRWGYKGFAILSYADWVMNGMDAWVAVLGAPMRLEAASRTITKSSSKAAKTLQFAASSTVNSTSRSKALPKLSETESYLRTVVLGNDGVPENRFIDLPNARAAVEEVCVNLAFERLKERKSRKIAIYAHGGLNAEEDSVSRISAMAPYFEANGIVPIFITWKTGTRESIEGILSDKISDIFGGQKAEGLWDWAKEQFESAKAKAIEAKDRTVEVAAEQLLVKAIWSQMKQNAEASSRSHAGLGQIARALRILDKKVKLELNRNLEIHLVGHSAGSIVLGHFLGNMKRAKIKAASTTLFAAACTVEFANDKYGRAFANKTLSKKALYSHILSDERELGDSVGPYGKSLLYLVSRALEDVHRMPILGLETIWEDQDPNRNDFHHSQQKEVKDWQNLMRAGNDPEVVKRKRTKTATDGSTIATSHGSFDNDIEVMTQTLQRIRGSKLLRPITNLSGY
ncbi:MAG: C1 family peptidase [Planctomycetota bacterium]